MEIVAGTSAAEGRVNVMVVEAQPVMQMFYRKVLAPVEHRCFNVLFASSVREAVSLLDFEENFGGGIAYALLDWTLSDGTAVTFFNHVRTKHYGLRCMLITGHNDRSMLEFAKSTGIVDAFIGKPVSTAQIRTYWKKYVCPYSRFHHPDECCFETAMGFADPAQARAEDHGLHLPSAATYPRQ